MNRSNVRLNAECHGCVKLSKGSCKGKVNCTPCIIYQSKEQYKKDSIKAIKEMARNK